LAPANSDAHADRLAIHRTLLQYCRGVDRHDLDLIKSAFHSDAEANHGAALRGNAWEIWVRLFREPERTLSSQHHLTNEYIDVKGDVAYGETYFLAYFVRLSSEGRHELRTMGGRYIDRLEKRDGTWRIADRLSVVDWEKTEPTPPPSDDDLRVRGRRDRQDASFRR